MGDELMSSRGSAGRTPGDEDWVLSELQNALRRHFLVRPGDWDAETIEAAKTLSGRISTRLAGGYDR